jgi:uroporphyrinogen decarboxylase
MMRSIEIIRRTLEYDHPDRVAQSFPESDLCWAQCSAKTHATDWKETGGGRWVRTDEWGNTWGRVDPTSKGEVIKGVLENIEDIDTYRFPDYSCPEDYVCVAGKRVQEPDKWLFGLLPGFAFSIARKMRKLDQYLMDMLLEPDAMHKLHDRIDAMLEDMILNYAAAGVDSIMFCEDWGTQEQTLISPALWREEFFPRFVKLCEIAHDCGIKVFMHSCGKIGAIIPGLIEAGVDVLQFDQPDLHGIDTLAKYQKESRITFWCPVDVQKSLPQRDEEIIRSKAREMIDKLWQSRGGFIAGFYPDDASLGLAPKWQEIASDEFRKARLVSRYSVND